LVTTLEVRDPESPASATLILRPKDLQEEDQAPSRAPTPAGHLDPALQVVLSLLESPLDTLAQAHHLAVATSEALLPVPQLATVAPVEAVSPLVALLTPSVL